MNEQDSPEVTGSDALPHAAGEVGLPAQFDNPGLPPHVPRLSDLSEAAAKRAEKQVAGLFGLSILGTVLFLVAYFAVGLDRYVYVPGIGDTRASNLYLGLGMGLALLGIGLGAVHWAKTLMPDAESVEMRHPLRSSDEARDGFVEVMREGGEKAQLGRRPLIKSTLVGAMGLVALPLVLPVIGGLGPLPGDDLSFTYWDGEKGPDGKRVFASMRLMRDPENTAIKASDVTIGSVFHVMPEGLLDLHEGKLEAKAKAAVILMRLDESVIKSQKEKDWGYQGIVAYSKICTHVGCPVGLYEQQTHHLLCPCHQSTFDVTDDCKVIFGPAKRPLPQLPITVDAEGYLVSAAAFHEAVGPSFWERG